MFFEGNFFQVIFFFHAKGLPGTAKEGHSLVPVRAEQEEVLMAPHPHTIQHMMSTPMLRFPDISDGRTSRMQSSHRCCPQITICLNSDGNVSSSHDLRGMAFNK